jgi:hypothetical protein
MRHSNTRWAWHGSKLAKLQARACPFGQARAK